MSRIISIKIKEKDLDMINRASEVDRRARNSFMIVAGVERAEKVLNDDNR